MKEGLNRAAIERIAAGIRAIDPSFNTQAFMAIALHGLEHLVLKARVNHLIDCLHQQLPCFTTLAPKLCQLPAHWDHGDAGDPLKKFAAWPVIDYVAVHGINEPALAFKTLQALTSLYSAEFAIRPFIERYPQQSFEQLYRWAKHPNEHIRRLASEGCRPRLPWGAQLKQLIKQPAPILPILTALKNDDSLYVRKSVANNLNDISKDHPAVMLDLCRQWLAPNKQQALKQKPHPTDYTQWIIKHGCRTLVKAGNRECLQLLGINNACISHAQISCNAAVTQDYPLTITLQFLSQKDQTLIIDYAISFLRANGQHRTKVFKLKTIAAMRNQTITLHKNYSFKPISTRRYYKGPHSVSVQINGNVVASQDFILA